MNGLTIDELKVGDSAEQSKTVSETDIYLFAGITGDFNPAHVDEEYARRTFFGTRIAHGLLTAGFISAVLGCRLPGPGAVYMRQELSFLGPVTDRRHDHRARRGARDRPGEGARPAADHLRQPGGQAGADRRGAGQPAPAAQAAGVSVDPLPVRPWTR